MPGKKPSRFWKRVRQLFLFVFLLLLTPVLIWWIYNRIDEQPSEAALRLSATPLRVVADADNAWMHLFGIGAAQDQDVLSYARARLVASYADGIIDADGAPNPPLDPVPAVLPDAEVDGADALCSPREQDCIVEYTKIRAMVERLRAANALRLQRYESMLSVRDWQPQLPASQALSAFPDASVATLYLNIVAQDLAQAHNTRHLPDALKAAARLQKAHSFWSELRKQPMDLYGIVLSTRQLDDIRRLAWQYSNLRGETSAAIESVLDEILGSAAPPIQWRDAVASEFRARENYFRKQVPSTFASLWSCLDASTRFGCLTNAATALAFAPQATINLTAREMEAMQVWLEADARTQDIAGKAYSQVVESNMVQFEDMGVILRQMSHNYAGRILAIVAIPAVDWSMRVYDSEANRRMLWLQRQMHQKQIALNDVSAFLAQQDDGLRNPYDGEPFVWDANFRELQFAPKAKKYWKREQFTVPYDPDSKDLVVACPEPLLINLFRIENDEAQTVQPMAKVCSCGNGDLPNFECGMMHPEDPSQPWEPQNWYGSVPIWRHQNEISLRMPLDDEGLVKREHTVSIRSDQEPQFLRPTDPADRNTFALTFDDDQAPQMISARAVNVPASELAQAIVAIGRVRLRNPQRISNDRITVSGDQMLESVLAMLADISDLQLRKHAANDFSFEPITAAR